MKKWIIAANLALVLTGCSTQTYITSNQPAAGKANYDKTQHFFVQGIGQTRDVSATDICGDGNVAKVQTQQTFLNGFIGMLTQSIYTPRDIRVYCK